MKVSGLQIFWLMFSMEMGMTLLLTLPGAIADTKQDTWISMILASMFAITTTFIATKLSLLYPDLTFIEYSQRILGKWLGKIIVRLALVFRRLHTSGLASGKCHISRKNREYNFNSRTHPFLTANTEMPPM